MDLWSLSLIFLFLFSLFFDCVFLGLLCRFVFCFLLFFFLLFFLFFVFFFFQAEDGIRDHCVTGVQTCALPILTQGNAASSLAALPRGGDHLANRDSSKFGSKPPLGGVRSVAPAFRRGKRPDRKSVV